jgi:hypothetical protein
LGPPPNEVFDLVLLTQVVFVIGAPTDEPFLKETLERDERALIRLAGRLANNVTELLLALCQAANAKGSSEF